MTGQIQRSVLLLSLVLLSCSIETSRAFRSPPPTNYANRSRRSQQRTTRVKSSVTSSHDYDGMYSSQQSSDQSWYTSQNQLDQTYQKSESGLPHASFSSNDYGIVDTGTTFGVTLTSSNGLDNKKGMMQRICEAFRTNREIAAFKSMDELEKNQRTLDGGSLNRSKLTTMVLAAEQQRINSSDENDSYDIKYQRQLQQQQQQQPQSQQQQNNFVVEYSSSDKEFLDVSSFEKLVIQAATKLGEKTGNMFGGNDPENWRD